MLKLATIKNYLRVDFSMDDELLTTFMGVAEAYMRGALEQYDSMLEREHLKSKIEMCQLVIIQDLYENRNQAGYGIKDFGYTIRSMIGQLQFEPVIEEEFP